MATDDLESVRVPLSDERPPSLAVIEAVAALTNTEPKDCPILQHHVDTDALDNLFADQESCSVTFDYHGCRVSIRGGRAVIVELV